ncbi:MAG: SDR family NAD(P)-dependent oxidoreductase, partial [Hylemonella sp.]|nr:SDR family NAD(P)-dependent oxidoreductase [Hylemonella sp.]
MNQLDLQGRHAVITGGAAGLGFAIAQRLLASGAKVTLWDINAQTLAAAQAQLGAGADSVQVNVADHASVAAAAQQTAQRHGGIDVLVNSAGITGPNTKVWDYPTEDWRQVVDVNLNGLFYCCREVVPHMRERDYGRIVN